MNLRRTKFIGVIISVLMIVVMLVGCADVSSTKPDKTKKPSKATSGQDGATKDVLVNDIIKFGKYEQDNNTSNGKEDIEWIVLDKKDGKLFVTSKYALAAKPYNTEWVGVTWEKCTLRTWLNGAFLNDAFSSAEQTKILTTTVVNSDNPYNGTEGGNNTQDKVFLLSIEEANACFVSNKARALQGTEYAKANNLYTEGSGAYQGNCWWWLRSPGNSLNYVQAAYVHDGGYVLSGGNNVSDVSFGVRPAMWITLDSSETTSSTKKPVKATATPTATQKVSYYGSTAYVRPTQSATKTPVKTASQTKYPASTYNPYYDEPVVSDVPLPDEPDVEEMDCYVFEFRGTKDPEGSLENGYTYTQSYEAYWNCSELQTQNGLKVNIKGVDPYFYLYDFGVIDIQEYPIFKIVMKNNSSADSFDMFLFEQGDHVTNSDRIQRSEITKNDTSYKTYILNFGKYSSDSSYVAYGSLDKTISALRIDPLDISESNAEVLNNNCSVEIAYFGFFKTVADANAYK